MGNPRFLLVLGIEEVIGCTAKTIAEAQARGKDFWKVGDYDTTSHRHLPEEHLWLLNPRCFASFCTALSSAVPNWTEASVTGCLEVQLWCMSQLWCQPYPDVKG